MSGRNRTSAEELTVVTYTVTEGCAERVSSSARQVHHRFVAGYHQPPNLVRTLRNVRCNMQLGIRLALGALAAFA